MKVAILGGTGAFGRALAARAATEAGHQVVIGSRDAERARLAAEELARTNVTGAANSEAVRGTDLVVLAVKADAALATAAEIAGALGGETPLLSVASAIRFGMGVGMLPDPAEQSLAERIQALVQAPVVAGLHSVAAASLVEDGGDEDALVCGDSPSAKDAALAFADSIVSGRALDAGPLASARALEGLTAVIVNLNRRYRAHAGIRVTGL